MGRVSFGSQHPTPFAQGGEGCFAHQSSYPFAKGSYIDYFKSMMTFIARQEWLLPDPASIEAFLVSLCWGVEYRP